MGQIFLFNKKLAENNDVWYVLVSYADHFQSVEKLACRLDDTTPTPSAFFSVIWLSVFSSDAFYLTVCTSVTGCSLACKK